MLMISVVIFPYFRTTYEQTHFFQPANSTTFISREASLKFGDISPPSLIILRYFFLQSAPALYYWR